MSLSVIVTEKGGAPERLAFEGQAITIGRADGNDLCLRRENVSKQHARIVVEDGRILVVDLESTNGTYVNGERLGAPQVVTQADQVAVGEFLLRVEPESARDAPATAEPPVHTPADPAATRTRIHEQLIEALDLRRLDLDALGGGELWARAEAAVRQIVGRMDAAGELDAHEIARRSSRTCSTRRWAWGRWSTTWPTTP